MKQKLLKTLVLPAILASSGIMSVQAQSIIYDNTTNSEYAKIRNYLPDVDITYNAILSNLSFNYVDRSSQTTYYADVSGLFLVQDFVVFDDSVFFCGTYDGYYAMYGYFDINDFFFSSGTLTYIVVTDHSLYNTQIGRVRTLNEIAVMRSASGETHLVMTGRGNNYDSTVYYNGSHYYSAGVIADAWIDASNNYNLYYTVDDSYKFIFDDVEITEDYAVISAHTATDANQTHNILYYANPINHGDSYFPSLTINTPLMETPPNIFFLQGQYKIHLTAMSGNGFATVSRGVDADSNSSLIVSIYNNPLNPPIQRFSLNLDDWCQEIAYNKNQKTLYILPGLSNTLYNTTPPFSQTVIFTADNCRWTSIDNADNNMFEIIAGCDLSIYEKKLWRLDVNSLNPCVRFNKVHNGDLSIQENNTFLPQIVNPALYSINSAYTEIKKSNFKILCVSAN